MSKLSKGILIVSGLLLTLLIVILFCLSIIAKWAIEKYDVKYTGREIQVKWVYINALSGYVHLDGLQIFELKSDSLFFSADGVSADLAMWKLLSGTYEISEATLNHPKGLIIQTKKHLNFSDLIERFTPKKKSTDKKPPLHFNILNINIEDAEFHYQETLIPINYFIKNVTIKSTGKRWDSDTLPAVFSLKSGTGQGEISGNFTLNLKSLDYRVAAVVHKFDLDLIQQYLKDLTNYGSFRASLEADIKANGNFKNEENLTASGKLAINDFHFGKTKTDDYASFEKLDLAIIELSPKNHRYNIDSISLQQPYFKYERYDSLDNIQTMFGIKGAKVKSVSSDPEQFNLVIEIARYVKVLAKNFIRSDYKINRVGIYRGDVKFNDFTNNEKFSAELNPLVVQSDSIDKSHKRVKISFNSAIKPYGSLAAWLSINPNDSSDFDLEVKLKKLPLAMFNPYLIKFTSFPMDRGTLELNALWNVNNGQIHSKNHLILIDPRTTKRIKNKANKWIPLPLIMAFVREQGNVIDYEVPITGNLKSPKFHFRDVITDIIGNIFIKPLTTPYRMEVKQLEIDIEKSFTIKWPVGGYSLTQNQTKILKKLAKFLADNPQATFQIVPKLYKDKEWEAILFYEAKKMYFIKTNNILATNFTVDDSLLVSAISIKDKQFGNYLQLQNKKNLIFTIQEKCANLVSTKIIEEDLKRLNQRRASSFMEVFKNQEVSKQLKITAIERVIPFNGYSFFEIKHKGEIPPNLASALTEMNILNEENPRVDYQNLRKKSVQRKGN